MTEPDEAILWAREDYARLFELHNPAKAGSIRIGNYDHDAPSLRARCYRAGQAASAERIKALEGEINAARLGGIRLGLEAAFRAMLAQFFDQAMGPPKWHMLGESINALDPETIAKEADQ